MTSTDNVSIGSPVQTKGHIFLPIERTEIIRGGNKQGCWFHCSKKLIALVVQTAEGIQAFDIDTGPIAVGELKNIVPELEAYLRPQDS